jgi:hypothetical protein
MANLSDAELFEVVKGLRELYEDRRSAAGPRVATVPRTDSSTGFAAQARIPQRGPGLPKAQQKECRTPDE